MFPSVVRIDNLAQVLSLKVLVERELCAQLLVVGWARELAWKEAGTVLAVAHAYSAKPGERVLSVHMLVNLA